MRAKLRKKEKEYAQVHKKMLHDTSISFKSKGLGALLESYYDDYEISEKTLLDKSSKDKKTSLSTAVSELEPFYLCRIKTRKKGGTFEVVWVFDSQGISEEYVNQILEQYYVIEIFTLNYRHLLTTPRKTNSGLSSTGSTTIGQSGPMYNNKKYKNKEYKNISLERIDLRTFKKYLLEFCPNYEFVIAYPNEFNYIQEHKGFYLKNGYIYNQHVDDFCTSQTSFKIWQYLYEKRLQVFEQAAIQNESKSAS
jgi:hypothetical protein